MTADIVIWDTGVSYCTVKGRSMLMCRASCSKIRRQTVLSGDELPDVLSVSCKEMPRGSRNKVNWVIAEDSPTCKEILHAKTAAKPLYEGKRTLYVNRKLTILRYVEATGSPFQGVSSNVLPEYPSLPE